MITDRQKEQLYIVPETGELPPRGPGKPQCEICKFEKRPVTAKADTLKTEKLKSAASVSQNVDRLQFELGKLPQLDMPLMHTFCNGVYIRTIFMPKGAVVISRIHKTTHPFVVSKGHAAVWDEKTGVQHVRAPHAGITTPGTRRILFIHEDCIWTTFHVTDETDPDKIVAQVTETPDVSYVAGVEGESKQSLIRLLEAFK